MNFLKKVGYWISAPFRRKPDFIIIGVQKGGTSSLFSYLDQHPQLRLSRVKEVHYFDVNYWKPYFIYRSYFPIQKGKFLTGEASPYYIFHPLVARRIKKHLPKAKFIVMFRDPIKRAFSHYNMELRKGKEDINSFLEAIQQEEERLLMVAKRHSSKSSYYNSLPHQTYTYLSRGKYFEQLSAWFEIFPREQFCILKSEDFFEHPKEELKKVYDFLGLDEVYPENLTPMNVGNYSTDIDEAVVDYCNTYFREDSENLRFLLGDQFSWGRDK